MKKISARTFNAHNEAMGREYFARQLAKRTKKP